MSRLERDLPIPDTGSLRGDLTAWATSAAADLARPEGRLFLLALITSIPSTPQAQAVWYRSLPRVT
jgi:tetracycline repressor-like protein